MEILSPLQELDDSLRAFRRPFLRHASCTFSLSSHPSSLSSSSFAFSRHRFDNLIIRYRYTNNRRTRYFPLLASHLARSREDREITFFVVLLSLLPRLHGFPFDAIKFTPPRLLKAVGQCLRKMIIRSG